MISSLVAKASGCKCKLCNGHGFISSICRHGGICGAADEAVLNTVHEIHEKPKNPPVILDIRRRPSCVYLVYTDYHDIYFKYEFEEVCDFSQRKPPLTQLKRYLGRKILK